MKKNKSNKKVKKSENFKTDYIILCTKNNKKECYMNYLKDSLQN